MVRNWKMPFSNTIVETGSKLATSRAPTTTGNPPKENSTTKSQQQKMQQHLMPPALSKNMGSFFNTIKCHPNKYIS